MFLVLCSCSTLQVESTGFLDLNLEGVACFVIDRSGDRNRHSEHLWIAHLVPLPGTATPHNPGSTTHRRWIHCAHEPCSSSGDKQRAAMALMLLSFVTQEQETSKALAPVLPVIVHIFNRDCPHTKQPTNQGEHFEKTVGPNQKGREQHRAALYGIVQLCTATSSTHPAASLASSHHQYFPLANASENRVL